MHVGEEKLSWGNVLYSLLLKARCTQSSSMAQVMHGGGVKEKVMCSGVYGRQAIGGVGR